MNTHYGEHVEMWISFLNNENYLKAKPFLLSISAHNKQERFYSKEMGFYIKDWLVEIHGSMRTGLSSRIDKEIDKVQHDIFYRGSVRSWMNDNTHVFLPSPDNDVFIVFTHFIKHFYKEGGVTLRQICDWCRLIWTFRDLLNRELLRERIKRSGLTTEWKTFGAMAVNYLGMPLNVMPLYSSDKKWRNKARKLLSYIIKGVEWRKYHDTFLLANVFPISIIKYWPGIILNVNFQKIKERLLLSR